MLSVTQTVLSRPFTTAMASHKRPHDEDHEEAEEGEKRCRLCYGGEEDGPLVQPCACNGSMKWIHQHCLERWRRTSTRDDAAYCCGECRDYYHDGKRIRLVRVGYRVRVGV